MQTSSFTTLFFPILALACGQDKSTQTEPLGGAPSPQAVTEAEIAVLPSNTVLHSGKNKISAFRGDGELAWELSLPNEDSIAARVATGLNSTAYVRGNKGLYAAGPDGKWLWTAPLPPERGSRSRALSTPVALSDSTAALAVGDEIVSYDHQGKVRWKLTIPEGRLAGAPAAGMDGSVLVPTTLGIYSINPSGAVSWRRPIGG
jgi:outer membrane protein assembly factor BamB